MVRRPLLVLWFLPLVMAMESPGCVMSREPLRPLGNDSVDFALLGDWVDSGDPSDDLVLRVSLRDDRTMEVWSFDGNHYTVLAGYVSELAGEQFLNLQFVDADCEDCDADERERAKLRFRTDFGSVIPDVAGNECTWLVVRYRHESGRVRFWLPDPEIVSADLESGALRGEQAEGGAYSHCVTDSARRWRRYVSRRASAIFLDEDSELLTPGSPESRGTRPQ